MGSGCQVGTVAPHERGGATRTPWAAYAGCASRPHRAQQPVRQPLRILEWAGRDEVEKVAMLLSRPTKSAKLEGQKE